MRTLQIEYSESGDRQSAYIVFDPNQHGENKFFIASTDSGEEILFENNTGWDSFRAALHDVLRKLKTSREGRVIGISRIWA